MENLTRIFFAPLTLLTIALLSTGCSSAQTRDDSDNLVSESSTVVTTQQDSSVADTSSTAEISDDSEMETNTDSGTENAEAAEDAMSNEESAAEKPQNAYMSLTPEVQYTCKHDTSVRTIRVYSGATQGLACEVTYEKSSGTTTLWTAINSTEYCLDKAIAFAEKQVGWGWRCEDMNGNVVSLPEPEPEAEAVPEAEPNSETETTSDLQEASTIESSAEAVDTSDTASGSETEVMPASDAMSETEPTLEDENN